jgi:hypothetical protein
MIRPITIGGRVIELEWSQRTARLYVVRSAKLGLDPLSLMGKPAQRVYAVAAFFWLLLPPAEHAKFDNPEELFATMSDEEFNSPETLETLIALFDDINPPAEKKSTSKNSPSPASSSGSRKKPGRK